MAGKIIIIWTIILINYCTDQKILIYTELKMNFSKCRKIKCLNGGDACKKIFSLYQKVQCTKVKSIYAKPYEEATSTI